MALGGLGGAGKAASSAIKAGETYVEISADDSRFTSTIKGISNKLTGLGHRLKTVGLATVAAGSAVLTPLVATFTEAIKLGDEVNKAADRMNGSAEAVSALAYAAKQSDTDIEALVKGNAKLAKNAVAAAGGAEDQAKAFEQMGISANDFLALDVDERFVRIADTLQKLETPLDKQTFLTNTLGKSYTELLPLLKGGGEELHNLFKEAEKVGAVISSEDAKKSTELVDTLDRTWKALKMTILEVGFSLLGLQGDINSGSSVIIDNLQTVRQWIKDNRVLVVGVAAVAIAVIGLGSALALAGLGLTGIITLITTLISVGGAVIGAVFSPLALSIAAVVAVLAALAIGMHEGLGLLSEFDGLGANLIQTFADMKDAFFQTFGTIVDFLSKGEMANAFETGWIGIQLIWTQGLLAIQKFWDQFKKSFVDGWHDIITSVQLIFIDFAAFIMRTFGDVINAILEGAAQAADFATLDETARDIRKAKIDTTGINAGRDLAAKELMQQSQRDQKVRDDYRDAKEQELQTRIDLLKQRLDELSLLAKQPVNNIAVAPMPRAKVDKVADGLIKLGAAAKGLFSSSDYRGSLGLGPANPEDKKQTKLMQDQLLELKKLNKKTGPAFT